MNKISRRLLRLEFKSDNIIRSKAIKFILKKILLDYKQQWKLIASVVTKDAINENSSVRKTKQNRLMLLSSCANCGKKIQFLIKIKNSTILTIFEMVSLK